MLNRIPEGFRRLPGKGSARRIRNGARNHHRHADIVIVEILEHRVDGSLAVQGVEYGLDQNDIGAAFEKAVGRFRIGLDQGIEGDVAITGIVDIRRD